MRNPLRSTTAAVALACLTFVASACSGGDDGSDAATGSTDESDESATTDGPSGDLELEAGETTVEVIGEPVELPKKVRQAVMEQTRRYVELATVDPLLGNESDDELESLFFFTLASGVAPDGPDRAALTDEAVPPAVGDLETSAKPVKISALSNGFGGWVMVAATIDYTVSADVEGGPVTIKRSGDLYFAENPDDGEWLISAYDIGVARETDNDKAESSARSGTTTTSATESTDAQEESE